MENQHKEIEHNLRKTLEYWAEIVEDSTENGWAADMDFTNQDVYNAAVVMTTICSIIGVKNGAMKSEKDMKRLGKNLAYFLSDTFGIDLKNV